MRILVLSNEVWNDKINGNNVTTNWFEETYPSAKINYVRAGIGATGSYIGVHRVDKDVLANNPDLVFVEFSVNDTTENTERNKESYDSLLRKIWNYQSAPAIICIGMTQEDGTTFQNYHFEIVIVYYSTLYNYYLSSLYDSLSDYQSSYNYYTLK